MTIRPYVDNSKKSTPQKSLRYKTLGKRIQTSRNNFRPPPVADSGELPERLVDRGAGEPVGQGGHGVGADAEHDLERVPLGVALGQERLQRVIAHVAGRLQYPQRERPDRFQPLVRQRRLVLLG